MSRTRTELKHEAQDAIMTAIGSAFCSEESDDPKLRAEMDKQMKRIEKLFGYEEGSWGRGV